MTQVWSAWWCISNMLLRKPHVLQLLVLTFPLRGTNMSLKPAQSTKSPICGDVSNLTRNHLIKRSFFFQAACSSRNSSEWFSESFFLSVGIICKIEGKPLFLQFRQGHQSWTLRQKRRAPPNPGKVLWIWEEFQTCWRLIFNEAAAERPPALKGIIWTPCSASDSLGSGTKE